MTVFFNNVPFKASEEEIKEFLSSGGAPVKEVRLVLDKFSKKSKGFGYADFETAEDRQKCIDVSLSLCKNLLLLLIIL